MFRSVLKRYSRGKVLRRRLPARFGRQLLYVSPESALKYWYFNLEKVDPPLIKSAEEIVREGNIVWDIGANVGLFAFVAASLTGRSGRVLAVEPDIFMASLLRQSSLKKTMGRAEVDVLPVAVSDRLGLHRLRVPGFGRASNFLRGTFHPNEVGGVYEEQIAVTVTLDWLLEHYGEPSVVKIDVQNAEAMVIQGAKKLLNKVRPIILCEVGEKNSLMVSDLFVDSGYILFDAGVEKRKRRALERAVWNTLAMPG